MFSFSKIGILLGAAVVLAAPAAPAAESLADLPVPGYAGGPLPPRTVAVAPRITRIVYPTLGLTALVRAGDRFTALLAGRCPAPASPVTARLELVGVTPPIEIPLYVQEITSDNPTDGPRHVELTVPPDLAADLYDLVVEQQACFSDRQPSSVRVHRLDDDGAFRFAVLSDQQISDPTGRMDQGNRNPGLYPAQDADRPRALARQIRDELEFLDPLFVIYPGDLVFGMDYAEEYPEVHEFWSAARLGLLAVPGNHDAYAAHRLGLSPNWLAATAEVVFCGRKLLDDPGLEGIFNVLSCVLRRLHGFVEGDLEHDGLELWRRFFGPARYAVRVGGLRLIGINTYGGSRARRASVSLSLDWVRAILEVVEKVTSWDQQEEKQIFDRAGAPLVDNYGGFLDEPEIAWAAQQLQAARRAGELPVLFGHHDPRGNLRPGADRYEPNQPFLTNPFGLGDFEVWNYDGEGWDSDPGDRIGVETEQRNSGTRLLAALAGGPAYYFLGHAHHDRHDFVRAGGRVPGTEGLIADGDLHIVQTTTGGASVYGDDAYRGYRVVEARAGAVQRVDFLPEAGLGSWPAGNFWIERLAREDGPPDQRVTSALPVTLRGRLRFELPARDEGYRFYAADGEAEQRLRLTDLTRAGGRFVAYTALELPGTRWPAGDVPPDEPALVTRRVRWEPAAGNRPPVAAIRLPGPEPAVAGLPVTLSATDSRDPEGEPLLRVVWKAAGREQVGETITLNYDEVGRHPVTLTAIDACGASHTVSAEVTVETEQQHLARRAMPRWKIAAAVGAMLGLVLILLLLARKRT